MAPADPNAEVDVEEEDDDDEGGDWVDEEEGKACEELSVTLSDRLEESAESEEADDALLSG